MTFDVTPISCRVAMSLIHPFIDNEIEDSATFSAIAHHLQSCPECAARTERERRQILALREILSRSCIEITPEEVHQAILVEIHGIAAQMQAPGFVERARTTEIYTQYRKTEITIDGETTIEIEESREIRRDFPL